MGIIKMGTKIAYFNYIDGLEVPDWVVDSCPQSGNCDNALAEFREDDEVKAELDKLDPEQLKKELAEYGAWDDEQLNNHDENLTRILWIAIGNIWEEKHEDYGKD